MRLASLESQVQNHNSPTSADTKGTSADTIGACADNVGASADTRDTSADTRGTSAAKKIQDSQLIVSVCVCCCGNCLWCGINCNSATCCANCFILVLKLIADFRI